MKQPKTGSCFVAQQFVPSTRFLWRRKHSHSCINSYWEQKRNNYSKFRVFQNILAMHNHKELLVQTPSRQYPIYFGTEILDKREYFEPHIPGDKVLIVTNNVVGPLYLERVKRALEKTDKLVYSLEIPDGEIHKNLTTLSIIYDKCMEKRLDRKSTLVALGGGVIGDLTGFAAATFVRGVPFIQVPTTLLAVVDSAVGGKTGVNHPKGKNMIGAFYQPQVSVCLIVIVSILMHLVRPLLQM